MSDKLIKCLIEALVEKALQPEAPPDASFGQYLFAPERKDILSAVKAPASLKRTSFDYPSHAAMVQAHKNRIKDMKKFGIEPNTTKEDEFLRALQQHYENGRGDGLDKIAPEIIKALNNNQYQKILSPPAGTVYRVLWNLSPPAAAKILNLPVKKITAQKNKPQLAKSGGILNRMKGSKVQSWSLKVDTSWTNELFSDGLNPSHVAIVLAADTKTDGNKFFMNPKTATNINHLPADMIENEQEVISYGPVNYFEAGFYYVSNDYGEGEWTSDVLDKISKVMKF